MINLVATLAFARALARETGAYLKPFAGRGSAETKADGSFVTQFDIESDRRITEGILARHPGHHVMSEERAKVFEGAEWTWVLDPIDGTTNFTWGYPLWGVLIGLLHHGDPVLGVAEFPVLGEQYWAARGHGAWLNGAPINAARQQQLGPKDFVGICTRASERSAFPLRAKARISGSSGYDLALVARGVYTGMYNVSAHMWDVAALWPIVSEAGGTSQTMTEAPLFPLKQGTDTGTLKFGVAGAGTQQALAQVRDAFTKAPPSARGRHGAK